MSKDIEKNNATVAEELSAQNAMAGNTIKCVVAVMSGKGGVGKSFVTGLLASGLAHEKYKVGILDADITGPSIPMLFGLHGPVLAGETGIEPLQSRSGIKIISTNLLLPSEDQPVIWRGPLISKMIRQLWEDVAWGELDYLLVDLPPGTSDAALTIMQSLPVKGVVMVVTPQKLAALIVKKAVHMAKQVGIPVIGIVENMAFFRCPDTGKEHLVFGQSHIDSVSELAQESFQARIPLDPDVTELCDSGRIEDLPLGEHLDLILKFIETVPVQTDKINTGGHASGEQNIADELKVERSVEAGTEESGDIEVDGDVPEYGHFSEIAKRLIRTRENMGVMQKPDAQGFFRGSCGDSMQVDLRINGEIITEAKYSTDGCGATVACGSMVTKMALSKSLTEAMQITPENLISALAGLPRQHEHCAELAVMTLRETLIDATDGRAKV